MKIKDPKIVPCLIDHLNRTLVFNVLISFKCVLTQQMDSKNFWQRSNWWFFINKYSKEDFLASRECSCCWIFPSPPCPQACLFPSEVLGTLKHSLLQCWVYWSGESAAIGTDRWTCHSLGPSEWDRTCRSVPAAGLSPQTPCTPKPAFLPAMSLEPCNRACCNTEGF